VPFEFRKLPGSFAICQLPPNAPLPAFNVIGPFTSMTRTGDELSIVCLTDQVPDKAKYEAPWICLELEGPFPFSQVGVLASFIDPLARCGVPILAISTFDTDYVLVREQSAATALKVLQDAGHERKE
jgi:uncharacterized protein